MAVLYWFAVKLRAKPEATACPLLGMKGLDERRDSARGHQNARLESPRMECQSNFCCFPTRLRCKIAKKGSNPKNQYLFSKIWPKPIKLLLPGILFRAQNTATCVKTTIKHMAKKQSLIKVIVFICADDSEVNINDLFTSLGPV